jgi:hypothetical protein
MHRVSAADNLGNALDKSRNGSDEVDYTGGNRALRHRRVFGFIGVLYENNATCLLHGTNAERSV